MLITILYSTLISISITKYFLLVFKNNYLVYPNSRSSHVRPTPTGGAIGFVSVGIVGFLINENYLPTIFLVLAIVGLIDDIRKLNVKIRLYIQTIVAIIYNYFAIKESFYSSNILISEYIVIRILVILSLTFICISIINFSNFMDGIDGILGSSMLIIFFTSYKVVDQSFIYLVGGLLGFLFFNWHPAKVFMGDAGSYFLGALYYSSIIQADSLEKAIGLLIVGVPIYADAMYCLIRRIYNKQPITKPHKLHLYQRLTDNGWGHTKVSLLYLIATTILSISFLIGNIYYLIIIALIELMIGYILDKKYAISFQ